MKQKWKFNLIKFKFKYVLSSLQDGGDNFTTNIV